MAKTTSVRQVPTPPDLSRVETGAVRFGDDWPGLFVRGDDAFAMMLEIRRLEELLAGHPNGEVRFRLASLRNYADIIDAAVVVRRPDLAVVDGPP